MIDKYRLEDLRRESGEKGELARWVIQLQKDLDDERRKAAVRPPDVDERLAAHEQEPVRRVNAAQMHRVCLEANRHLDKYGAMAKEVNKLLLRHPAAAVPEGYCMMPLKLSAENGAKGALSGEFHVTHRIVCQSCGGEGCEDCNEEGGWDGEILIGWDIIKQIHEAAVEACALPAAPKV